jgi:hypothetical protein
MGISPSLGLYLHTDIRASSGFEHMVKAFDGVKTDRAVTAISSLKAGSNRKRTSGGASIGATAEVASVAVQWH